MNYFYILHYFFLFINRQQQLIRQQAALKVMQAQQAGQKVSVAVTAATAQQRATLMKQAGVVTSGTAVVQGKPTTVARTISEAEMAALIKHKTMLQQQAKAQGQQVVTAQTGLTPAQLFKQAGLQQAGTSAGGGGGTQVATLVKPAGVAGVRTASPQTIRHLQLQSSPHATIIGQRKVAQLAQVAGKAGVQTQLIVQQKSLPAGMTVQQIQQVMKHVQPSQMQQFVSFFILFLLKKN